MRTLALVCAVVLVATGMAAGAIAEESAEALDQPASENCPSVAEYSEPAAGTTTGDTTSNRSPDWNAFIQEAGEWLSEEERGSTEAESPAVNSVEAEPTEAENAEAESFESGPFEAESADVEYSEEADAPEKGEAYTEKSESLYIAKQANALTEESMEAAMEEPTAPEYEANIREEAPSALSFSGWDYADMWSKSTEKDNSGIVSVQTGTSINTRPNDKAGALTWVSRGTELEYLNVTEYDDSDVAWYQVYWDGWTGWVSSRNTRLWWPTYY